MEKGENMVTIKMIAEKAGVSRGTVDRVLNNRSGVNAETFQKVKEIAEKLGYEPNLAGQMLATRKKKIKLGYIVCDTTVDLFFKSVYAAAMKKAEELQQFGVTVEFYLIRELEDASIRSVLETVDFENLDGIAVVPLKLPSMMEFIKKVNEKQIPLVFFNLDAENSEKLAYVGCDYYESGRVAAGLVALVSPRKGKVAVASIFDDESPSFFNRYKGFLNELDMNYPELEIVNRETEIIFQKDDYSSIQKVMTEHSDIDSIYVVNPGNYRICEEISKLDMDKKVKIITNDIVKEQKRLMDEGIIVATIGQQPERQGTLPLQILYDYIGLGIVPQKYYYTELTIYIKQNISSATV